MENTKHCDNCGLKITDIDYANGNGLCNNCREKRFCVKCGKTSGLLEDEDICYTCAKERGRD